MLENIILLQFSLLLYVNAALTAVLKQCYFSSVPFFTTELN